MSSFNNDIVELAVKVISAKCEYHKLIMDQFEEKNKTTYEILKKQRLDMLKAIKIIETLSGCY